MTVKGSFNLQLGFGLALLLFVLGVSLLPFLLNGRISLDIDLNNRLGPPGRDHVLGTDDLGRDLLSCLGQGVLISLCTGISAVAIAVVLGWVTGLLAGLMGGLIDFAIMRIVDVLLAFPGVLLAVSLAALVGGGVAELIFILGCTSWVALARMVRAEVLKHKYCTFVIAARSYNCPFLRLLIHHFIPLTLPIVLTQSSLTISGIILAESTLNFLGIGFSPLIPSLGQIISQAKHHIFDRPDLILLPGLILLVLVAAFIFIGEGLRKLFYG